MKIENVSSTQEASSTVLAGSETPLKSEPRADGTTPGGGERAERPWFMWTQRNLSLWERVKLLLGWKLFVRFDAPSGRCSAACELTHEVSRSEYTEQLWLGPVGEDAPHRERKSPNDSQATKTRRCPVCEGAGEDRVMHAAGWPMKCNVCSGTGAVVDPTKQDPHSLQQRVRALHGAPYEDDGNCEMCNASGPTWEAEEPITWNRIPLCAACIEAAERSNAESSDSRP